MLVTATVKREADAPIGLTIESNDKKTKVGQLVITSIDQTGPFFGGPLRVGMELKSINNVDCSIMTVPSAMKLLEAKAFMTVLAQQPEPLPEGTMVTATMIKSGSVSKIGVGLKKVEDEMLISKVRDGTLASLSTLRPGMVLAKINNVNCNDLSPMEAATLMAETEGPVTLLARVPTSVPDASTGSSEWLSKFATATADLGEAEKVGLELSDNEDAGTVVISSIDAEGPFFGTPLRVGSQLLQVNNTPCKSAEQTMALLKESEGLVTLLSFRCLSRFAPGTLLSVVVTKETADTPMGVRLGISEESCVITMIRDGTPAAMTVLEVGMMVHSINNTHCTDMSPGAVSKMLAEAEGDITILVQVPPVESAEGEEAPAATNPYSLVTATMIKTDAESKVGVTLLRKEEGAGIFITKIAEGSLAESTKLKVGMEVLSINNVDVTDMDTRMAVDLLAEQGTVTMIVKKPILPPGSLITAAMFKETPEQKCGVRLGVVDDKVVIKNIFVDSPAAETELEPGMLIKAINNVDCSEKTPYEVGELLATDELTVTILAEATAETNTVSRSKIMSVRQIETHASMSTMSEVESEASGEEEAAEVEAEDVQAEEKVTPTMPVPEVESAGEESDSDDSVYGSEPGDEEPAAPAAPVCEAPKEESVELYPTKGGHPKSEETDETFSQTSSKEDDVVEVTWTTNNGSFSHLVTNIVEC
jgi:C-terminal processing protease CtpA/Prc